MNPRQRKFVEAYKGNATAAAREAGYAGNDVTLANVGHQLLMKPEIAAIIKGREDKEIEGLVASRVDRMKFWSEVMRDEETSMSDRLRASELLAKAQMDFTERHEVVGAVATTEQLLTLMRARRMENNDSDDPA